MKKSLVPGLNSVLLVGMQAQVKVRFDSGAPAADNADRFDFSVYLQPQPQPKPRGKAQWKRERAGRRS